MTRSLIPETFLLIEQICSRTAQIDNLRTPVAVFLQSRAFKAIECITDSLTAAHNTLVLVVTEGAFVADTHEGSWAYVGITHGAFAIAFVTQAADGDTGLLAAHDEIGVVTRHDDMASDARGWIERELLKLSRIEDWKSLVEGKEASLEMKSRWRERRVWWSVRSASLVTFAPDTSASTEFDFAAKSFVCLVLSFF